jgi:hypothetical protein
MIELLRESLNTAQADLCRLVIEGKPTADARAEIEEIKAKIMAAERSHTADCARREDARLAAMVTEGQRLAAQTAATLESRLAAYDVDNI